MSSGHKTDQLPEPTRGHNIKHPVQDRVKPSFVIFDIWALWRSALSLDVKNYKWRLKPIRHYHQTVAGRIFNKSPTFHQVAIVHQQFVSSVETMLNVSMGSRVRRRIRSPFLGISTKRRVKARGGLFSCWLERQGRPVLADTQARAA